jgi:hypothetical protein
VLGQIGWYYDSVSLVRRFIGPESLYINIKIHIIYAAYRPASCGSVPWRPGSKGSHLPIEAWSLRRELRPASVPTRVPTDSIRWCCIPQACLASQASQAWSKTRCFMRAISKRNHSFSQTPSCLLEHSNLPPCLTTTCLAFTQNEALAVTLIILAPLKIAYQRPIFSVPHTENIIFDYWGRHCASLVAHVLNHVT